MTVTAADADSDVKVPPVAAAAPTTEDAADTADADATDVEKGHQGQARKDMETVTDYVDETKASGAVDQNKLDKALTLIQEAKKGPKTQKTEKEIELDKVVVRKQDVELLMREFEMSKTQADQELRQCGGDVQATIRHLVGA